MNWLKAFWMGLSKPPEAADKNRTDPPAPNTPITAIRKAWHWEPSSVSAYGAGELTPRAQKVLALSRKEADRFNHNFVGTEHLLLGLLALGQGVAINVLQKMGLDLGTCRAEVEKIVGRGPDQKMIGNIPYTPRVRKVLALAAKEAKALNHTYIGTEHILLGFLHEGDGVAARVLQNLGVDVEKTREEIIKELDPNFASLDSTDRTASSAEVDPPVDRSDLRRDLFTPRVRRAFTLAREEAGQRNQPLLETQHVLLGLIRMGQGVAADVLIKIGVNAEIVAARMDEPVAPGSAGKVAKLPAPLVQELLAFAAEEARALDHTYIGTEHILLGLLRQPHGGAARIFKELYVDTNALRQQIVIAFEVKTIDPNAPRPRDKNLEPFGPKDTEMFAKTPGSASPVPASTHREPVDTAQRYDVYCMEPNEKTVVYRNVQFKSHQGLFPRNDYDHSADFVELEQADGQKIFVAKSSITRFCPPGVKPGVENQ